MVAGHLASIFLHTQDLAFLSAALTLPFNPPSNHRNKSLAPGNKAGLIFLSKVQAGNQEVEIALSTSLGYNLASERDKLQ